ncbi:hypothetical protein HK102_007174 [Quaeritorhiza haematococci]|nr:hypothetical protein HK102_007174 [Quaeritorhiza haematococci]
MGYLKPFACAVTALGCLATRAAALTTDGYAIMNAQDARPFLTFMAYDELTKSEIVESVYDVITGSYVHLKLKNDSLCDTIRMPDCHIRVDAQARLDRLVDLWQTRTEYGFHVGISNILYDLRDYHTAYMNPNPIRCMAAVNVLQLDLIGEPNSLPVVSGFSPFVAPEVFDKVGFGDTVLSINRIPWSETVSRARVGRENMAANEPAFQRNLVRFAYVKSGGVYHPTRWASTKYELRRQNGTVYTIRLPITFMAQSRCINNYLSSVSSRSDASEAEKILASAVEKAVKVGLENAKNYNLKVLSESAESSVPPFATRESEDVPLPVQNETVANAMKLLSDLKTPIYDRVGRDLEWLALRSAIKPNITNSSSFTDFTTTRDPTTYYGVWQTDGGNRLGVVYMETFVPYAVSAGRLTLSDWVMLVREILMDLDKKVDAIVFDVRSNPGGYGVLPLSLIQLFHHETAPTSMRLRNSDWNKNWIYNVEAMTGSANLFGNLLRDAQEGDYYTPAATEFPLESYLTVGQVTTKPVGLYVNGLCYSACDMFSAAVQGAGGAAVINYNTLVSADPTLGTPLPNGQDLYFSFAQLVRPDGKLIENDGVDVDVFVRKNVEDIQFGTGSFYDRIADILIEYGVSTGLSKISGTAAMCKRFVLILKVDVLPSELVQKLIPGPFEFEITASGVDTVELRSENTVLATQTLAAGSEPTTFRLPVKILEEQAGTYRRFDVVALLEGAVKFRTSRYQIYGPAPKPIVAIPIVPGTPYTWDVSDLTNVVIDNNALTNTVWHVGVDETTGLTALKATDRGLQTYSNDADTILTAYFNFTDVDPNRYQCSGYITFRTFAETGFDYLGLSFLNAVTGETLFGQSFTGNVNLVVGAASYTLCGKLLAVQARFVSDRSVSFEGAFIYSGVFDAVEITPSNPASGEIIQISPGARIPWTPDQTQFVKVTSNIPNNQTTIWNADIDTTTGRLALKATVPGQQYYTNFAITQAIFRVNFTTSSPTFHACGGSFEVRTQLEERADHLYILLDDANTNQRLGGFDFSWNFVLTLDWYDPTLCGRVVDMKLVFTSDYQGTAEGVFLYSAMFGSLSS